ncbi:MAG: 50S ribosomal protein L17 [Candidatus Omnitrophota bacterium]
MRHRKDSRHLGRFTSLKKATLRDLSRALLTHERIVTTAAKARLARKTVEGLIGLGKDGSLSARRMAFAILCDHSLVKRLFAEVAPRYKNRNGGFTKIFYLLQRRGDGAQKVVLELTDRVIKEKRKIIKPKAEKTAAPKEAPVVEEKTTPLPAPGQPEVKEVPLAPTEKKERPPKKPKEAEKPAAGKPKVEKAPKKKLFGGFRKLFKRPRDQK